MPRKDDGEPAWVHSKAYRTQGRFKINDDQGRLDDAVIGQIWYCPCCGEEYGLTHTGRQECKCGALWTISVGKSDDGNVVAVTLNRWR